jgi:hypothetical protein
MAYDAARSRRSIGARTATDRQKIATLQLELCRADERLLRICEAVETGVLPLDETLFGRDYLRAFADKVVVSGGTAAISGSNAHLMRAVSTKPLPGQVPSFFYDWFARSDCFGAFGPGSSNF